MLIKELKNKIEANDFAPLFSSLYGEDVCELAKQKKRYQAAVSRFEELYPTRSDARIFSASGRTEIGGNHTDHQNGCVLAAAVHLDIIGVVGFHSEGVIRVTSEGYKPFSISLADLSICSDDDGTAALVRGVIAGFAKKGIMVEGFDLYCTSEVLSGSGVSSSAAFETLIGTIVDCYYGQEKAVGAVEVAKIGQFSETVYLGKKSGLMDQMVSSVGGLVAIDFHDAENPVIKSFQYDFEKEGYSIFLTDTKGSHAGLTDDYVAIRTEMESVAEKFGVGCLREVDETAFYEALPKLRESCSDRALVRAAHFFADNRRAVEEAEALQNGDFQHFLELVRGSGESSSLYLQNIYTTQTPTRQEITLALLLSRRLLGKAGAARVHGGGFAGTIQAFVPKEKEQAYRAEMERIFGEGACVKLRIRPVGGLEVTKE